MNTVKQMLGAHEQKVWSIEATRSVFESIKLMAAKEVGALPVINDQGHLVGMISERDYARKVILKHKSSRETHVAEIMTTAVVYVGESTTVDQCMALMSQKKIRHLPVLEADTLVGMVTVGDLLKYIIKEQSMAIEELESYIMDETGGSG